MEQFCRFVVIFSCFALPVLSTTVIPTVCPHKTTSGQCCSIPFKYRGVTYNSCTEVNHHIPWCSLDSVYKRRWGNCLIPTPCPHKTTSGQCCSIPFKYRGVTYYSCTNAGHHRSWCSLDSVYKGRWRNCLNPTPTACLQKTTSGHCYSIPFTYQGVTYNSCTKVNHNGLWCSLDPLYEGRWGNCLIPTPTVCLQRTTTGECCSIPFTYNGVQYSACTKANHNRPWCSLDAIYKGRWGNCQV